MRIRVSLAASGLALSLFALAAPSVAQERLDANGLPTTRSTPAEQAATADLNNQIQANNAAVEAQAAQDQANYQAQVAANNAQAATNDAQYQAQQQQYQNQLQQNQAAQQDYNDRTRAYYDLRARYAAERAAYHRAVWPSRYSSWRLQSDARLVGSRVEIINGAHVGTVDYVVRTPSGHIDALAVTLDNGKQVWIDENDIRFNRANGVVVTNLDRGDLYRMADLRG
jgi:multidrug efflux pump subunit AcrA (membrane-fusion protein)